MRQMKELLAAQTAAAQSNAIWVAQGQKATFMASPNLAGAETAQVQISHDDGTTWVDFNDGTLRELTATISVLQIDGPALLRVDKDASAGATGIFVYDGSFGAS